MKKLALAICLLLASIAAQAQFEKGTMILNPSVTGLDFSYSKNDDAKFGIGAQAGTFLADGFALMVNAGADWSQPVDIYTLGTGARCYFNTTGNPGMATGGSGDVLTGVVLALLAQGYTSEDAACLAMYVHGLAGDIACKKYGAIGMTAGDIVTCLPLAWRMMEE